MNVIDHYKWRYATKKFDTKKKISNSNIELIKESISLAPTSYGLQLFKVIIVEKKEIKDDLKKASFNQSQISDASHIFIFCNSTKIVENDIDTYIKNKAAIQNKTISEISGYGDFLKDTLLKKEHNKISTWTANQVYIALSHLMTFCPSLGIDSWPIEGFEASKYNKILKLNNRNLNSTVVAAVGYRSNKDSSQYEKDKKVQWWTIWNSISGFIKKINQIFTLCILGLIWGSSFILMKRGLESYPPLEITLYRIFIVFLVFTPIGIKDFLNFKKTGLILLLSAIIGSVIPYFLFIKAQTKIDSSLNGILNSITPLFTLIFGVILFKQKINLKALSGVLLGLIGASGLIIISNGYNTTFSRDYFYAILPVIGSACYALNINLIKNYLHDIPALKITSWSFIFIGPIAGILLLFYTDFTTHLINDDLII